jgi:hypothetical protein
LIESDLGGGGGGKETMTPNQLKLLFFPETCLA